jgi:hypothetical protein
VLDPAEGEQEVQLSSSSTCPQVTRIIYRHDYPDLPWVALIVMIGLFACTMRATRRKDRFDIEVSLALVDIRDGQEIDILQ